MTDTNATPRRPARKPTPRKTSRRQRNWFDWSVILPRAAEIVNDFATAVTLRQLHYLLVSLGIGGYNNTQSAYTGLSKKTAELRRLDQFPRLSDFGRGVHRQSVWDDPAHAVLALAEQYRIDRTIGQQFQLWVLMEKLTLQAQMRTITDPLGLPIAAMRGYSSESLEAEIFEDMLDDGRSVVAFYVGDFDPEGEDIERNFLVQANKKQIALTEGVNWFRLGVLPAHIDEYGLLENPGKQSSPRAKKFAERHGRLVQVEVEALPPDVLGQLVTDAIDEYFDRDVYTEARRTERQGVRILDRIVGELDPTLPHVDGRRRITAAEADAHARVVLAEMDPDDEYGDLLDDEDEDDDE